MNKEFIEFIERNNIDINAIYEDLQIYNEKEINRLISDYKLEGDKIEATVSIADIIGYDYSWREQSNNLARNFGSFFGTGSSYQSRSLGMLEYTSDEVVKKLEPSFDIEPIKVLELDNGRKVISVNGLHRYTLLRIHYINELHRVKGDKEKEEQIREKYKIPVKLAKVDLLKTYCHFLIKSASPSRIYVSNKYDQNYNRTGKVEVSSENSKLILSDEELLTYTKNQIRNMPSDRVEWFLLDINIYREKYDSFQLFIDTYFSEEIARLSEQTNKKRRGGQ